MSPTREYDSQFWRILEKNRLVDLSQFHRPGFHDEVPLYTRLTDISFLKDHSKAAANEIILGFALRFLNSVLSYEKHNTPYFAAITVSTISEDDPVVPSLFIWFDSFPELHQRLALSPVKTPFGKTIKKLVTRLGSAEPLETLEDAAATQELPRVFIAPLLPEYPAMVPLYSFCNPAKRARAR